MTDIFHQDAFAEINRDGSKLRTYAKIKTESGFESYLMNIKTVRKRISLSRIRLSTHDLMIEKGRHSNLKVNQRTCPFCTGNVLEDELHFLLVCNIFSLLRNDLLKDAKYIFPEFETWDKGQQFKALLSDERLVNPTATYFYKALELRRFILRKHKNVT